VRSALEAANLISCAMPAGTQIARCGGVIHEPRSVQTVSTPEEA